MTAFNKLNSARGQLFQSVNAAVNDAAFSLAERIAMNELLAEPLAADHLLLAQAAVQAKGDAAMNGVTGELDGAREKMDAVLAGHNSAAKRRAAIDALDAACDTLSALMS